MRWWSACSLVLALGCQGSMGVPWSGGFGSGSEGDLFVTPEDTGGVNACFTIESVDGKNLNLTSWLDQPVEREVLLLQMQAPVGTSGDGTPLDDAAMGDVGYWERVRVEGTPEAGDSKTIPLLSAPSSPFVTDAVVGKRAMACTVREFESVTIESGAVLAAKPWNGSIGGIIAIRVRGTLRVDGQITATGAGYRGGQPRPDNGQSQSNNFEDLDVDSSTGLGGGKGEGLNGLSWEQSARGNLANGAGGGNVHNAGGGGGGCGGAGGFGGKQYPGDGATTYDNPNTRGMPGAPVATLDRLFYGGGGGSGQQNDGQGGAGGAGGGLIFIEAARLEGSGAIVANGQNGFDAGNDPATGYPDGAGGGGAGGVIWLSVGESSFDGAISANGGDGGDTEDEFDAQKGPGGGGGGGIVVLDGLTQPAPEVSGGVPGQYRSTTIEDEWGATAGESGVIVTQ